MSEPFSVRTAEQLNQQLEKYKADAAGPWPERFALRPVMNGQVAVTAGLEGDVQRYSLWMERGPSGRFDHFTLLTQKQAEAYYNRQALEGVIAPITRNINPITGQTVQARYSEDKLWYNEATGEEADFKAKLVWIDPKTATVISGPDAIKNMPEEIWVKDDPAIKLGSVIAEDQKFIPPQGYVYDNKFYNVLSDKDVASLRESAMAIGRAVNAEAAEVITLEPALLGADILTLYKSLDEPKTEAPKPEAEPVAPVVYEPADQPETLSGKFNMVSEGTSPTVPVPATQPAEKPENPQADMMELMRARQEEIMRSFNEAVKGTATTQPVMTFRMPAPATQPTTQPEIPLLQLVKIEEMQKQAEESLIKQGMSPEKAKIFSDKIGAAFTEKPVTLEDAMKKMSEMQEDTLKRLPVLSQEAIRQSIQTPRFAADIFQKDVSSGEIMKSFGLAPVGDATKTVKMEDGTVCALWQKDNGKGGVNNILRTPSELVMEYSHACMEKLSSGKMYDFEQSGSLMRRIKISEEAIHADKPTYDLTAQKLTDLDPAMRAGALRRMGSEDAALEIEKNMQTAAATTQPAVTTTAPVQP